MHNPLGRYRDPIFFASGFAGLIYESIWTHYLKLFLGHAAYAQTLVLAIFMGGMAVGAALTARYTARIALPLRTYALVEAAIGILALAFHPVFRLTTQTFYDVAFDAHFGSFAFVSIKWGLAILLILPQSMLLGATFPLFVSAATRSSPASAGRSIASLYFANSIGGAAGVLIAGFILVPSLGLFGTIATAGGLNLAIAAIVLALSNLALTRAIARDQSDSEAAVTRRQVGKAAAARDRGRQTGARAGEKQAAGKHDRHRPAQAATATAAAPPVELRPDVATRLLLAVSFLTGASSFIYEIGWIRMLALVLGSATHSFELMLSSFLLGLALGGLWIRKRIDTAANPAVFLAYVQIAMGCAALATVPLHNVSFDVVGWTLSELPKTDTGYAAFNVVRYGVASLIMFPATFCAGMTLPLVTRLLYSIASHGERAIGLVYSTNTMGAIAGLVFAVHIGFSVLGLEYLVASGAVIDVLLGAALLAVFGARAKRRYAYAAVLLGIAAIFAVAQTFDPQKLASSVYLTGTVATRGTILEIAHGKTATISVETDSEGFVSIRTNGKTDASANVKAAGRISPDQLTMALLGIVPLLIHDAPRQVANIGFGSGLTAAAVLADPRVLNLDTIEIEPKMVKLARHFDPLNRSVYVDPRSRVRIEDAKSFFAANGRTYDIIISEPSNPWMSGISSLFSVEFYRHVSRYLNDDGLFVQWLPTYEAHADRIASVLKAMAKAFDDYMILAIDNSEILLVAKPHGKLVMPANAHATLPPGLKAHLREVQIANQSDITFRIAGNKALFQPWLASLPVAANSDFAPYLDSNADRDRFFNQDWPEFIEVALSAVPIAEFLGARPPLQTPSALTITSHFGREPLWLSARMIGEALSGAMQGPDTIAIPRQLGQNAAGQSALLLEACNNPPQADITLPAARFATRVLPYLSREEGRDVLDALRDKACLANLTGPQAKWHELLRAVADRDAAAFGKVADEMLMAGQGNSVVKTRYLLAMAMLGHIRTGHSDRARALWTQFSPTAVGNEPPGMVMELLHAHAFAAARQ